MTDNYSRIAVRLLVLGLVHGKANQSNFRELRATYAAARRRKKSSSSMPTRDFGDSLVQSIRKSNRQIDLPWRAKDVTTQENA
jgi:hypothetical protein